MSHQHINTADQDHFLQVMKIADSGDPGALHKLADLYTTGKGTVVNYYKAIEMLRLSAENGGGYAAYLVGELYLTGKYNGRLMIDPDLNEALNWFELSVKNKTKFGISKINEIMEMKQRIETDYLRIKKLDTWTQTDMFPVMKDAEVQAGFIQMKDAETQTNPEDVIRIVDSYFS